ncbi:MAG: M23 family metallopeptidase, partial [Pedobacter sp.]
MLFALGINAQDKKKEDIKSIKSMCGCYEVEFNFAETFKYAKNDDYKASPTKYEKGLEWVELVEDTPNKIVMQHLLQVSDTMVIKHWRQDWEFENTRLYEYNKDNSWKYVTLPKDKFPVSKGKFIAYSGNTGGSQGPHVHFEIRDTKSGECLNPLLFGFQLPDNVPPSLVKLAMYDRMHSTYSGAPKFFAVKKTESGYIIPKMPVVEVNSNKISFGIQAFDRMNGSENQDGIYSAELFIDDVSQVKFIIDSISYEETSYMNAHIDYQFKYNGGAFIQHLSKLPGDKSGVYHPAGADGVVLFNDTSIHAVRIMISDARQNSSTLNFNIRFAGVEAIIPGQPATAQFLPAQENRISKPDFELYMPESCLYDTVGVFYYKSAAASPNSVTANYQLNDPSVPVEGNLSVRLKPDRAIPDEWKEKIVIQRSYRNSESVKKASVIKVGASDWVTAEFGDFGNFRGFVDLTS